jgi:error-prone DNA polymerase
MNQIKGFSEYGFPESHAASFAIIVLASAWIKKHYPAQFCVSLLNSQPMGFYAPAQIIKDAQNHGVEIEAIDINYSDWETTINIKDSPKNMNKKGVVRLGMHLVKGLERRQGELIALIIKAFGPMSTIQELWRAAYNISSGIRLKKDTLVKLAQANGFKSLGLNEREALWEIRGLMSQPTPFLESDDHSGRSQLPNSTLSRDVALDYATTGFSLRAHPVSLIRETLTKKYRARTWENISNDQTIKLGSLITICGLVIVRQRPETSKGVVFLSIEDETGIINVIISPPTFDKYAREIMNESVLIVRGNYRNIGPVIYCVAKDIEAISLN